jgi:hypothetical protein
MYVYSSNIIANVSHASLDKSVVLAIQKNFKLISDGGDSGSKK